ncbi:Integrase-like protein [Theobroma cacao]|uniref:Integrase-like protein n=1 Tax=Theobroma cacao TaxID=3641 RepID=A0A061F2Y2_THECC|nr:Integrase-like protein [Theobroma cacao]
MGSRLAFREMSVYQGTAVVVTSSRGVPDRDSIFWELPYWHSNLIRHNLDVMHIEQTVFENLFNTLLDIKGKSKDNLKAILNLKTYCKQLDLDLVEHNGKFFQPKSAFTLTKEQINDYKAIEINILLNCEELEPYIEKYDEETRKVIPNISNGELEKSRETNFESWLRNFVNIPRIVENNKDQVDSHVENISYCPSRLVSESGLEEVEPILELEEENQRGYDDEFEKEEREKEEDKYLFEESKEQNVVVEGLEFNYSSSDDSTNDESEDIQGDIPPLVPPSALPTTIEPPSTQPTTAMPPSIQPIIVEPPSTQPITIMPHSIQLLIVEPPSTQPIIIMPHSIQLLTIKPLLT